MASLGTAATGCHGLFRYENRSSSPNNPAGKDRRHEVFAGEARRVGGGDAGDERDHEPAPSEGPGQEPTEEDESPPLLSFVHTCLTDYEVRFRTLPHALFLAELYSALLVSTPTLSSSEQTALHQKGVLNQKATS